jgi:hypothetical protein
MVVADGQTGSRVVIREAAYWQTLQVYPEAIANPETTERYETKAAKFLTE